IERERDAGRVVRTEPLARDPGMRPHPQLALCELIEQIVEAILEPSACDGDLEILEAKLEQLLVGQSGPGKFLARHDVSGSYYEVAPSHGVNSTGFRKAIEGFRIV